MAHRSNGPVDGTRWRALWASVTGVLCLVGLAQLVGVRELYLVAVFCLAPIAGLLLNRPPRGLAVYVPRSITGTAGEPVRHRVDFHNTTGRALPPCRVTLATPGLADAELWCPQLPAGQRANADVIRTALARGTATTHTVRIVGTGLGGSYHPVELVLDGRIVVRPHLAEPLGCARAETGQDGPSLVKGGHELSGVRQWAPGDSRRGVHWRATARHGTLVVADREQPQADAFAAVVVGGVSAAAEQALAKVAAGAAAAVRAGRPVRVVYAGPGRLEGAPTHSCALLLDWLAALPGEPVESSGLPEPAAVAALLRGEGAWLVRPAGSSEGWLAELNGRVELVDVPGDRPFSGGWVGS